MAISYRNLSRRLVVATPLAAATSAVWAAPAGAHHDPDELLRIEAAAEAIGTTNSGGGIPADVLLLATLGLVGLFIATRARGRFRLKSPTLRRTLGILSTVSLISVPLAAVSADAATILLPDLISDQPDPNGSVEINTYTGSARLILRFDGYVTNVGAGPLEVSGNPQITDPANPAAVHQRAQDNNGNWQVVGTPLVQFETADSHDHFHLMEVGRYSLWNQAKSAEAAPGQKVGFCLYDIERAEAEDYSGTQYSREYTGSVTQFCDSGNPSTTDLVMGTSAGWRDVYGAYLTFQWIDVSDTSPGIYYLANEADPHNRILESDETNNQIGFSEQSSTIPGYNALPVSGVETLEATAVSLSLTSESFGSPGARRFRVVTAPANGTLNRSVGTKFSSSSITYTPNPGFAGADSFEYVALDNSSAFPLNPTNAAVSINVGEAPTPSVEISGAPASLIAGVSASLTATVTNASPPVTWSVDGVDGGNSTVGTVDSAGLYIAPGAVPAGGVVAVRATLDSNPSIYDEVTITIDPIPNNAPVVQQPDDQVSYEGENIGVVVGANDPDGDSFTFSAAGLPPGTAINQNTGVISGTTTTAGNYVVVVTADDGKDPASVIFDWVVDVRASVRPGLVAGHEGDVGTQIWSIPLHLSDPVSQPVTVDWTTVNTASPGIANSPSDYVAASGTVTFVPGEILQTVEVEINGDLEVEPPAWMGEWGVVHFTSNSLNATVDQFFFGIGLIVIVDDD